MHIEDTDFPDESQKSLTDNFSKHDIIIKGAGQTMSGLNKNDILACKITGKQTGR